MKFPTGGYSPRVAPAAGIGEIPMPTVTVRMGGDRAGKVYCIPDMPRSIATSGFLFMGDHDYMQRVLKLARKGVGKVSPNPLVGSIIVSNDVVVGSGYHKEFGGSHAEINALRNAGSEAIGGTLYSNLEPCSHTGKTPPCVGAIINGGIKRVVIGMKDPNPRVNGKGIVMLQSNSIEVTTGVSVDECEALNVAFIKYITTGLPYVTIKIAQTLDGKISRKQNVRTQISSDKALHYVHTLRAEHDAVIIGKGTAQIDNPLLTTQFARGKTPIRVILDTHLECPESLSMFGTLNSGKIIIATASQDRERIQFFERMGVEILCIKKNNTGMVNIQELLTMLGKRSISSVLVEGGAHVFTSFLYGRLADSVKIVISPLIFGSGINGLSNFTVNGDYIKLSNITKKMLGDDILLSGTPVYLRNQ